MTYSRRVLSTSGMTKSWDRRDVLKLGLKISEIPLRRGEYFKETNRSWQIWDDYGRRDTQPKKNVTKILTKDGWIDAQV